ncbi:MAG: AMP-binding protein [Thermoanaerobaculia bacterium]|nr:AMP-binding protein [Thermoanaerobaculia bacterium]
MNTIQVLEATAERIPDRDAYHRWTGAEWSPTSWSEYRDSVRSVGRSLIALGVKSGDAISIIGANRPEWFLSYLGSMAAGAIPSGLYTTNTAGQCEYIVEHSESVTSPRTTTCS